MALANPTAGFGSTAEFQVSGIPWVTSSIVTGVRRFDFQHVTRTLTMKNASGASNVRVSFTQNGQESNYFELTSGEAYSGELRVAQVWVSGSGNTVSIVAGCTTIPSRGMFPLTGSVGVEGVG